MLKRSALIAAVPLLLFAALVVFLGLPARAAGGFPVQSYQESLTVQSLTQPLPTLSTDGLELRGAVALRVTVCAENGQTLGGSGFLRSSLRVPTLGKWSRNKDLDLPVTLSGGPCQSWGDLKTLVGRGRVAFTADGITESGGTTVTVLVEEVVL